MEYNILVNNSPQDLKQEENMKKNYRWDNLTSPEIRKMAENNAIVGVHEKDFEEGIRAIHATTTGMTEFVRNFRKMN